MPIISLGQNFGQDMASITNSCINLKSNYTITSAMRAKNGQTRDQTVNIRMSGRDQYYAYDQKTELLINRDMKIMLNKEFKVMMIDSSRVREKLDKLPIELFDTFANIYSSINFKQLTPFKCQYTLVPIAGEVKKIVLVFDSRNYRIEKINMDAYDMASAQDYTMTMTYVYSVFTSIPSTTSYVKKRSDGDLALQTKWQSYELLNYYTPKN
ncbi:MAG: hypothetical protein ACJAXV_000220 [Bacteroidia bacterium]|jgi:hypothetical protein|tara:strand:- start:2868 stop:3500 length:633 start_codon:yes stop_codon:yes gene_type:complete